MSKIKEYFEFRCTHKPDAVLQRLQAQVKELRDHEYLLEETEVGFDLGIGRGGHQGGYWYCATVLPDGDGSLISGRVVYRDWHGKEIMVTWIDKIEFGCLFLVILPIALLFWIYRVFRPQVTYEDCFVEFLVTQMDCVPLE